MKPRKPQDIEAEYQRLAMELGHMQYHLYILPSDIEAKKVRMKELNAEILTSRGYWDEEKKEAATQTNEPVQNQGV